MPTWDDAAHQQILPPDRTSVAYRRELKEMGLTFKRGPFQLPFDEARAPLTRT